MSVSNHKPVALEIERFSAASLSYAKWHSKNNLFEKKTTTICTNFCVCHPMLHFLTIPSCQLSIRTSPLRGGQAVQQCNVSFAHQWTIISFWWWVLQPIQWKVSPYSQSAVLSFSFLSPSFKKKQGTFGIEKEPVRCMSTNRKNLFSLITKPLW